MNNNPSVNIAKKEMQKAIINELYKKEVIDFCQCNTIIRKLDEDIIKIKKILKKTEELTNIVVKVSI